MKGGIYVGPLPESSKPLSRPSAIKNKKEALEAQALQDHLDPDDNKVYDDILTVVNTAKPESFATFARGKAIALLSRESLAGIINDAERKRQRPLDPATRQPLEASVLAWYYQISSELPFELVAMIPTEFSVTKLVANANYLTLVDSQGNFTIYNKDIEEVTTLEAPAHNSIFVAEDGKHAITYDYLSTGFSTTTNIDEPVSYYWTITSDKDTKKNMGTPAVKGAFITSNDEAYIFYTGEGFKRWRHVEQKNGKLRFTGDTVTRDDLYHPDKTYPMQIHYTNNKLIYYNSTTYFISYVTRNEDNTFSVLCENTPYVNSRYAGNDVSPTAFSLDGTLMATYVRPLGKIYIYDITQNKPVLLTEVKPDIIGFRQAYLAFSTDKKYLFVAYSNLILVYNISATPTLIQKIQVGKTPSTSRPYIPPIRLAYFNNFVVAALGNLVYFFREE